MFKDKRIVVVSDEFPTKDEEIKARELFEDNNNILFYSEVVFVRRFKGLDEKLECIGVINFTDNKDIDKLYSDVLVGAKEPVVEAETVVEEVKEEPVEEAPAAKPAKRTRRTTKSKTEE